VVGPIFKENKEANERIETAILSLKNLDYVGRAQVQFRGMFEPPNYALNTDVDPSITDGQMYTVAEILLKAGIGKLPSTTDKLLNSYKTACDSILNKG